MNEPAKVFAIAAHPDDIEFLMAGTLIRLRKAGWEIHYMTIADGSCGTTQYDVETIVAMREEEARSAAAELGAVYHPPLCHDLEIFYEHELLAKLASTMRAVAPSIVLTHSPSDYMEDHMNACRLAVTAAFARGMPNFPVEPPRMAVSRKVTVYHAQPYGHCDPLGQLVIPHFYVDTTDVIEEKVALLAKHASQKRWLDESQGLDSYLHALRDLDRQLGKLSGRFTFAEGWRRHVHLGFCDPDDDPLVDVLQDHLWRDNQQ